VSSKPDFGQWAFFAQYEMSVIHGRLMMRNCLFVFGVSECCFLSNNFKRLKIKPIQKKFPFRYVYLIDACMHAQGIVVVVAFLCRIKEVIKSSWKRNFDYLRPRFGQDKGKDRCLVCRIIMLSEL
jgi:hypothetical protein